MRMIKRGESALALLRCRMRWPKSLREDRQGTLKLLTGSIRIARLGQQRAEPPDAQRGVRMLLTKHCFINDQRPLEIWPRPGQVALCSEQCSQVVQATRRIGVLLPQYLLPYHQRSLVVGTRPGQVALCSE